MPLLNYLRHRRNCQRKQAERASRIDNLPALYHAPLTTNDITILNTPISSLVGIIQSKDSWKPIDVLRAYGKKAIKAHEATNCLTEVMVDEAEGWTKNIDMKGPLAGVPISLKDTVAVKGYDNCMGYSSLTGQPANVNSSMVRLLKDAGAIPYVKTNVPITLLSFESTNDVWGRTSNPHNEDYSPGGSTGGESALLAYGGSRIGIGTDVAGSVRVPAHFSGIYTVRCSTGRFMRSGNKTSMPGQEGVLAVYSPMARTFDDLLYFFKSYFSMKPWTYDHSVHPIPWRQEEYDRGKGKLRYGVMRDDGVITPTPACKRGLNMVVDALLENGDEVVELTDMPSPFTGLRIASVLLNSDKGATASRLFTSMFEYNDAGVTVLFRWLKTPWLVKNIWSFYARYIRRDPLWADLYDTPAPKDVEEQWRLVGQREMYRGKWHDYLNEKGIDILLCVPNATPAVPKDGMRESLSSCGYTFLFNLLDYSAGTLPVTHVDASKDALPANFQLKSLNGIAQGAYIHYDASKMDGLPIGVQVVGKRLEEELVLGAMEKIEGLLEKKGEKYQLLEVD